VSGKGVSAALLMARLSAAVRFCLASEPSVPAAIRELNLLLERCGSEGHFVTFVVAVLDLDSYEMTLVNAAHPAPLRRRGAAAEIAELGDGIIGLPLGVFDRPYQELRVPLLPGDTVVMFTDGVTEARNPQRDLYGLERLRAVIAAAPPGPEAVGRAVLADVERFVAGAGQSDDLTIVCFGRK
jgi:serine phosphatase RsbU (regulator of sigma subunit)